MLMTHKVGLTFKIQRLMKEHQLTLQQRVEQFLLAVILKLTFLQAQGLFVFQLEQDL
jgi:hypothetical protein